MIGKYIASASRKDNKSIYGRLDDNKKLSVMKQKSDFDKFTRGSSKWETRQRDESHFRREQLGSANIQIIIEFPINCPGNLGIIIHNLIIRVIINFYKFSNVTFPRWKSCYN